MVYFKDKICEIKNKLVKAIFYYITVIMLVLDPIYLCLLSGAFGGGDVNGILYLMPQATGCLRIRSVIIRKKKRC